MTGGGAALTRRALLVAVGAGLLAACSGPFADVRLRLATGSPQGVYFRLGSVLAAAWRDDLGLAAAPEVLSTAGSGENLALLLAGQADVVFSQADVAVEELGALAPADAPRALARIYDDAVQVVVADDSPFTTVSGLRGARVSVGAADSGVSVVSARLLAAAGLTEADLAAERLGLDDSAQALLDGRIDAFFWSGGLPTPAVEALARRLPIRLLDLSADGTLDAVREQHPVYAPGTVPALRYAGLRDPVATMLVRNVLLVPAALPDDLAAALVEVLFTERARLAQAGPAALTIDPRAAIGTEPVLLHPGAERFFRDTRD